MSFEKNVQEKKSRGLRNEIWGLHTLQGEVNEGERETVRDSEREEGPGFQAGGKVSRTSKK